MKCVKSQPKWCLPIVVIVVHSNWRIILFLDVFPGPNLCRRSPPSCVLTATRSTSSPTAAPPSALSASSSPYCPPLTSAFAPGSASGACPRPSCLCLPNHASWRSLRASDNPRRLWVSTAPPPPHLQNTKKKTKKRKHWRQNNAFSMPAKLSDVLILLIKLFPLPPQMMTTWAACSLCGMFAANISLLSIYLKFWLSSCF